MNSNSTYYFGASIMIQVLCQVFSLDPHNNPIGTIIYLL